MERIERNMNRLRSLIDQAKVVLEGMGHTVRVEYEFDSAYIYLNGRTGGADYMFVEDGCPCCALFSKREQAPEWPGTALCRCRFCVN